MRCAQHHLQDDHPVAHVLEEVVHVPGSGLGLGLGLRLGLRLGEGYRRIGYAQTWLGIGLGFVLGLGLGLGSG